ATAWGQLGYDENAEAEAKNAFDLSAKLSRAGRLLVEGRYRETSREWGKAIEIYRALFEFFPDNLDYGLALAIAQVSANKWKDALDTIATLREMPSPLRDDPRIDLAEDDAARSLGDTKRAEAALARAAERARVKGATLLLATARLDQAWLFENIGRLDEVEEVVREAMPLYVAANDRRGVARALTLKAIARENQGDYLGAKKGYEESLEICRQIGNRSRQASLLAGLGGVLRFEGDVAAARKNEIEAEGIFLEIGDKSSAAQANLHLARLFLDEDKSADAALAARRVA